MVKKKSRNLSNHYTDLIVCVCVLAAEALLLWLFHVGQPLTGYTLMLLTVCIGAMLCGRTGGIILGAAGGIAAFLCGFPAGIFAAPAIYKLMIALLPKMLLGFTVGVCYGKMPARLNTTLSGIVCVLIGLIVNACVVCLVMLLGTLLDDTIGSMDLLGTVKSILYTFVHIGRSIFDILVP